ncbi:MAG: hypothetical protein DRO11_04140 [Methanobacteriota archaeon]|nr:MAG: hypothetical protein DRO11_04140 [Euryarchaeota archaeon]
MTRLKDQIKQSIADLIDTITHENIAEATELVAKRLGLSERLINYTHVEFRNKLNEPRFRKVPQHERVLLLPHCLRDTTVCPNVYGEDGLKCDGCEKCQVGRIKTLVEKRYGVKTFILPGGSMVTKIIKRHRPRAVVGVACFEEVNLGFDKLRQLGIPVQGVLLLRDGCKDTQVNVDEILEKLELVDSQPRESGDE